MKQFKNIEEFRQWIREVTECSTVEEMLSGEKNNPEHIIEELIADGYEDLDNLVEDGHAYQIGEHTNNGWLYEDEADLEYIRSSGRNTELRKR